jgi:predicted RNA-binding Zn-ribbon protein involved in translation (DUF1610 family)
MPKLKRKKKLNEEHWDFSEPEPLEEIESERFTACPNCGSEAWDELYYDKKSGHPKNCNECRYYEKH